MSFRKIISLSIALSFVILLITGVLSFFSEYTRKVATVHSVFGGLFALAALMHIWNNFKPLKTYTKSIGFPLVIIGVCLFLASAYQEIQPVKAMMDWGARTKAQSGKEVDASKYEFFEFNMENELQLSIDLLRGKHFWHPQIAIWLEDSLGNYETTLYVTKATAKGIFSGGRTKANFKTFDEAKINDNAAYRRVDALPVWSHKRGVQYEDGLYAPTSDSPLADGMTGATPLESFNLMTSIEQQEKFILKLEINVAFDDNEYYSEFDFPDDTTFHNGTGQLGQPSLVFGTTIDKTDGKAYYLLELLGHGHHSGTTGAIYKETESLSTALEIVERIVVGITNKAQNLML